MRFGIASAALAATDQVKNKIGGAARSSGRKHRGPRPREKDKEERTPPPQGRVDRGERGERAFSVASV